MADDQKLADAIINIIRPILEPIGFESATISFGEDHDGDPSVFALVTYRKNAPPFNARLSLEASSRAHQFLYNQGDRRFFYLEDRFQDGEAPLNDMLVPPRRGKRAAR